MSSKKTQTPPTEAVTETPAIPETPPFQLPQIPTESKLVVAELKKLVFTAGTQPRVSIDPELIKEYQEKIEVEMAKEGNTNENVEVWWPFPPIDAVRTPEGEIIPWDGFQRSGAARAAKLKDIPINIVEGDAQLAVILSLSANAKHGARRTKRDKANAVKRAFEDKQIATLSDYAIAELCDVSPSMVNSHRPATKSPTTRVTKKGKTMDTSKTGKKGGKTPKAKKEKPNEGEKQAKKQLEANARLSECAQKIEQAIGGADGAKVREGIVNGKIELSLKELNEFAKFPEDTIKKIHPLIASNSMKPFKALEFMREEVSDKIVAELKNKALSRGGLYEYQADGVLITASIVS